MIHQQPDPSAVAAAPDGPGAPPASRVTAAAEAAAAGLDALLAVGRRGPLRMLPGVAGLKLAAALATRPGTVARRGAGLAFEIARIGLGVSPVAPDEDDVRYPAPGPEAGPLLRRAAQLHLAATRTADALVDDAGLAPADTARLRATVAAVSGVLAPSGAPRHGEVLREALTGRGTNAARGMRLLVSDLATARPGPLRPAAAAFELGSEVAATPGAVMLRTPVFELIQYLPQTEVVHEVPLLVVPPVLNRYYLADLAPGHSLVEHHVRAGVQVFAISWRNVAGAHAHWDLDTYGTAVLEALDAVDHIARTSRASLMAFGAGATITAMLLAHLAAAGNQHRVAAVTLAGAVPDGRPLTLDPDAARTAVADSRRLGHLDGGPLLTELAWRAPEALLWPQAVRRYLAGAQPPRSKVLYWLTDTTRVPAGLHRDLVDVALQAPLAVPGAASLLDTPLDLGKVDRDCYLMAGAEGPVTPWHDVYATAAEVAGACRFVLATGGRAASLVSPPDDAGIRYRAADAVPGDPARWHDDAPQCHGSWWDDHLAWLTERSGPLLDAPPGLGGRGMHAMAPAPGVYVLEP